VRQSRDEGRGPVQLELPLQPRSKTVSKAPPPQPAPAATAAAPAPPKPAFRVIQGGGQRAHEALTSRDAVARVLVEAGADLLLRRISPERAQVIERAVNDILDLFDAVDRAPDQMPALRRKLDDLEALMTQTREVRRRPGA
jgi:hypothetical protein